MLSSSRAGSPKRPTSARSSSPRADFFGPPEKIGPALLPTLEAPGPRPSGEPARPGPARARARARASRSRSPAPDHTGRPSPSASPRTRNPPTNPPIVPPIRPIDQPLAGPARQALADPDPETRGSPTRPIGRSGPPGTMPEHHFADDQPAPPRRSPRPGSPQLASRASLEPGPSREGLEALRKNPIDPADRQRRPGVAEPRSGLGVDELDVEIEPARGRRSLPARARS